MESVEILLDALWTIQITQNKDKKPFAGNNQDKQGDQSQDVLFDTKPVYTDIKIPTIQTKVQIANQNFSNDAITELSSRSVNPQVPSQMQSKFIKKDSEFNIDVDIKDSDEESQHDFKVPKSARGYTTGVHSTDALSTVQVANNDYRSNVAS